MQENKVNVTDTEENEYKLAELSDDIVRAHLPMIQSIAASVSAGGRLPPGITFNDLISFGYEGFVKAYHNFNEEKGVQFQTYAAYRVRGEMLDRIRKEWKYRNPVSYKSVQAKIQEKVTEVVNEAMESNEDIDEGAIEEKKQRAADIIANSAVVYLLSLDIEEVKNHLVGKNDIEEEVFNKIEFGHERKILWEEVADLTEQEKDFIHLFYEKEMNQKEIAEILNLSKSKASRLHYRILDKLRNRLKRKLNYE